MNNIELTITIFIIVLSIKCLIDIIVYILLFKFLLSEPKRIKNIEFKMNQLCNATNLEETKEITDYTQTKEPESSKNELIRNIIIISIILLIIILGIYIIIKK